MATNAPFPIRNDLTAITLAYRNQAFVADMVLPRVSVGKQEFEWLLHTKAEGFTIPDTLVGRKGRVNEVEYSATRLTAQTVDYGLEFVVPQTDLDNQPPNYNPLAVHTEHTTDLILLDREKRVADLVFDANQYAAANKTTLSGTSQWSDRSNSDPVDAILAQLDTCLIRPNKAIVGQAVWTELRQHPKVVSAVYTGGGNAATGGTVARQAVADVLELDEIIVGAAWYNSANAGQTASYGRLWGKHALFFYQNPQAQPTMGITFGMTAQWGTRIAGSWDDRNIGLRGGTRGRVGEGVKELITAPDVAFLFVNAVA